MTDCVEVIRCEDCRLWNPISDVDWGECFSDQWSDVYHIKETYPRDYCSYAERRDAS